MEAVLFNETRLQQTQICPENSKAQSYALFFLFQSFESKTHSSPLNLEEQMTYWHKQALVV
jgi:hypothetical protein